MHKRTNLKPNLKVYLYQVQVGRDNQTMKVIGSRDVTLNEDAIYKDDLATALSKNKQSQKVVFEELTDANVLHSETDEGLQNSGKVVETVNIEVSGCSEEDKDSKTEIPNQLENETPNQTNVETPNLRRSIRDWRPTSKYYPSVNYLLLMKNSFPYGG